MRYLAVLLLQALLTLVAQATSLTLCVFLDLTVDPLALTVMIMFVLMLVIYVGTDAGKLLEEK